MIVTFMAIIGSVVMAMIAVPILRYIGLNVSLKVSLIMSACIPSVIVPLHTTQIVNLLIKNKKLEEKLRQLATYDSLTKVLTRHAFMERACQCLEIAKRQDQPFAMLMLDIDHFKKINDEYGHQAGDKVLEAFGNSVQKISRKSDLAGRLGGEEFAFLLLNTPAENAKYFAERLLDEIVQTRVNYNGSLIEYTASIGIVSSPEIKIKNIEELYHLADKTLYNAKKSGRNQIKINTPQVLHG